MKVAARPNISIEETEINFLHGKTWIPGKASWEQITVTYYDVGGGYNDALWSWLATIYDFTAPDTMYMASKPSTYSGTGNLILYSGGGDMMEQWHLQHLWPSAINFGELEYATSDEVNIELTMRYDQVKFTPGCGSGDPDRCTDSCP